MLIYSATPGLVASHTPKPRIKKHKDKSKFYFKETTYKFDLSEKRRHLLKKTKVAYSNLPKDLAKTEAFFNLVTTVVIKRYG